MEKEKIKNTILIIFSVILIGIGYVNYNYKDTIEVAATENIIEDEKLGDVQLVNSENVIENEQDKVLPNEEKITTETDEYFSKTKLERENMYSQMTENYQKILDNSQITNEQKAIAIQEITNITNIKNGILMSETLIKNKGFDDVVILVSNSNATVIVKATLITQEQISQIKNIICRTLDIDISNITITKR